MLTRRTTFKALAALLLAPFSRRKAYPWSEASYIGVDVGPGASYSAIQWFGVRDGETKFLGTGDTLELTADCEGMEFVCLHSDGRFTPLEA